MTEQECIISFVLKIKRGNLFPSAVDVTLDRMKHSCQNSGHREVLQKNFHKTYRSYKRQLNKELVPQISGLIRQLLESNEDSCIVVVSTSGDAKDPEEPCAICLEKAGGPSVVLPCSHTYHRNCLVQWLSRKETCPLCRQPFPSNLLGIKGDPTLVNAELSSSA